MRGILSVAYEICGVSVVGRDDPKTPHQRDESSSEILEGGRSRKEEVQKKSLLESNPLPPIES